MRLIFCVDDVVRVVMCSGSVSSKRTWFNFWFVNRLNYSSVDLTICIYNISWNVIRKSHRLHCHVLKFFLLWECETANRTTLSDVGSFLASNRRKHFLPCWSQVQALWSINLKRVKAPPVHPYVSNVLPVTPWSSESIRLLWASEFREHCEESSQGSIATLTGCLRKLATENVIPVREFYQ
jgi:hypothetical protein